ncbi:MAG: hypothetical protein KJ072_14945 [Verrucomicrobia bacterium]|nr:hypothetical protein [Verrucomicrobiota bacterium]
MDDHELLREFDRERSEEAFRELVDRHLGMVYAAARRMVGDWHLAEEVAQDVFCTLARKAGTVRPPQVIAGWLDLVEGRRDAGRATLQSVIENGPGSGFEHHLHLMLREIASLTSACWDAPRSRRSVSPGNSNGCTWCFNIPASFNRSGSRFGHALVPGQGRREGGALRKEIHRSRRYSMIAK